VSAKGQILDTGEIVEAEPPRRLVIRWQNEFKPELKAEGASLCTIELEPIGTSVKLSITHTIDREPSKLFEAVSGGWPKVISNLKSVLETGSAVLTEAYSNQSAREAVPDVSLQELEVHLKRRNSSWPRSSSETIRRFSFQGGTATAPHAAAIV
jgi:hypothetical protein